MQTTQTDTQPPEQRLKELDLNLCQLLPPSPTSSGLLCGRQNATDHLPLPSIPPQFFAGASPTLLPPLFHYGFKITHQQLANAAAKRDLLVKSARLIDEYRKVDEEANGLVEAEECEAESEVVAPSDIPDIDIPKTLHKLRIHLRQRGFDFPYLRYTCGACWPGPMISILTNYQYKVRLTKAALRELQSVLLLNDKPVWDLDSDSKGWVYLPSQASTWCRQSTKAK